MPKEARIANVADVTCYRYEICSAPICPLNEESLREGQFFPGEDTCQSREYRREHWARVQRRINRKVRNQDRYFTYEMLLNITKVTLTLKGLDPNRPQKEQLAVWLKHHKRAIYSDERKAEMRERAKRLLLSGKSRPESAELSACQEKRPHTSISRLDPPEIETVRQLRGFKAPIITKEKTHEDRKRPAKNDRAADPAARFQNP